MFVLRASVWLRALQNLQPAMAAACRESYQTGTADGPFYRVGREAFERGPADSIDYAVMERLVQPSLAHDDLPEAAVVPLQAGWSDVGAWSALWDIRPADALGNVTEGDVYTHDTHDSLLLAGHRFVAALGVDHVVVIETPDAVLVTRKDRAQDVRHVVQWLKAQQRPEAETHRKVYRPWGSYESLDAGERFQVKRLTLYPGQAISLQMHHHRAEHWVVVRGTARVSRNEESFLLTENQSTYIPIGTTHRLENPGVLPLEIIEVQSGGYLGEDDVVRFEDRYHRTGGE
jgi:mannose-1-phosphate guanylyltransferase/mannose-6-phosphate isomerase